MQSLPNILPEDLWRRFWSPRFLFEDQARISSSTANPHLQQFRIVFITGIRSGILSQLDRSSMELIMRRAFTSVQLKTILEENHHPFLIVEHNPLSREEARIIVKNLTILTYSSS
jgi:hypothetical protein